MARLLVLFLVVTTAFPTLAQSTRPDAEILDVPSRTPSDTQFLQGSADAAPGVTLSGRLQLPGVGTGYPVVIMLHGSGGANNAGFDVWTRLFNEAGVASFRLDSYTGRGLTEIFSGQGRLGEFAVVYDIYRAIDVLGQHPAIDPTRIAVIGFSRGGIGALYSSLTRFSELYGSEFGRPALHLPFYPPCNFELQGELAISATPVRAFHGAADDWNPAAPCRDYIDRLAAERHDVEFTLYPDAQHAFDNPGVPTYFANSDAQTSRNCFRREVDGVLINTDTDQPFSWTDACVQMGPAQQYNGPAADAAMAAVREILIETFALTQPIAN